MVYVSRLSREKAGWVAGETEMDAGDKEHNRQGGVQDIPDDWEIDIVYRADEL